MTPRDDATLRQIAAADPARSTWVSANAGSGKTRVLTDRVARMLLDGVDPARILCLTYTKAAASEMQNRLFRRLGSWAMLPDDALRTALLELGIEGPLPGNRLARARTLFATAIETPGGLRIQTIHSFCASLLRRFPLEAGVSPRFAEMDDRAATLLRAEIIEDLAETGAPDIIARVAMAFTGEDVATLAAEIAGKRTGFATLLDDRSAREVFGVPANETPVAILSGVFRGDEGDLLVGVTAVMATGSVTDVKNADDLALIDTGTPDLTTLNRLENLFLYGPKTKSPHGAKTDRFPTKATQSALGPMLRPLHALMQRVEAARPRRIALMAADRTAALHAFAGAFLPEYAARKAARGLLDFDDLILRARALLTDPAVAQWVLFRLDGGIDHILVDEAQDTSPVQWQVIECLAAEFTAGRGASPRGRTLFVVGDRKQSIYSFQGADLRTFAATQSAFAARFDAVGTPLQQTGLHHSFRSSPAILHLVDATFDPAFGRALDGGATHIAHHPDMPGRVEVWPAFEKARDPEPEHWYDPVDLPTGEHHAARLATAIARRIRALVDARTPIPGKDGLRPVQPGDVLILVRRRSEIFHAIIAACKAAGLPIAGSDRMRLGGELAVRDIAALLSFLALPEDDLSLAAALRSPLFGWSEDALYRLARPRKGTLWATLRDTTEAPDTLAILHDLRGQADYLRPYELIERILTRHDGRRRLIARLGDEAQDGIDEMLAQALAYERQAVPGLTGFLVWLGADEVEVKRPAEGAGGRIRVMSIHGAKGLEAPLVILPDTAAYRRRERDEVLTAADGTPLWKTPADASPALIAEARAARRARDDAESLRLLYVAMTRAQSWLIVAAAGDLGKDTTDEDAPPPAWYHLIAEGMRAAGATSRADGGLDLSFGDWSRTPTPESTPETAPASAPPPPLPDWTARPAPAAPAPAKPLSPSDLGGAKALPGEAGQDDTAAKARGTALHRLLEHLPQHAAADWPLLAPDASLLAEARAVLDDPGLAHLFGPGSLAEVPFAADIGGRPVQGTIDRLVVTPTHVLAVDFKSNRMVPTSPQDVPEGILRQIGAYAAALAQIWPDRRIDLAILWTKGPLLMSLPLDIVRAALARTTGESLEHHVPA